MTHLTRWNPIYPTRSWSRELSDEIEGLLDWPFDRPMMSYRMGNLPVDVIDDGDAYLVRASVAGVDPNDIEITFSDNTLTIRGESSHEETQEETQYVMRERRYGHFARSITFPAAVDGDRIEAESANGELNLTLPKAEEARSRRIRIGREAGRRALDAEPGREIPLKESEPIYPIPGGSETGKQPANGDKDRQHALKSHGWVEGQAEMPDATTTPGEGWTEGMSRLNK